MKKILIILISFLFFNSVFASDEKPGRFFEDQPDVNDDYQIHFIYLLLLDGKDSELDISVWIEKRENSENGKFLKMSARNKKLNVIG